MAAAAKYLRVGTVRKPHGLRGEIVVQLDTDRADYVYRPGRVLQIGDGDGQPLGMTLTVEGSRPFKGGLLVRTTELKSLTDEVEGLRGRSLLIPADDAAPLGEDEVFHHELAGMAVLIDGERIGIVKDLVETAGSELLVVTRQGGRELLVPLVKEMVTSIDREARIVILDLPPGLLDL